MNHVKSADGTAIAIEEAGAGRPVVLLHGIGQSKAIWRELTTGPLAADHRFLAVDLRGHGDSDKPADREAYGRGRLGEDLAAVLESIEDDSQLPIIVAWSYAGVMIGEYLRARGGDALGGVVLLAAATCVGRNAKAYFGPAMMDNARSLMSDDTATYEAGSRSFLAACPVRPLSEAVAERALAEMQRVPSVARQALLSRSEDFIEDLASSTAPLAIVHGAEDRVVLAALGRRDATAKPGARFVELPRVGHVPWLEDPPAFETAFRYALSSV